MKHALATSARVIIRYEDSGLALEVSDDGKGFVRDVDGDDGHGLVGMRERVAMVGGELHVGNRVGGGFLVRAHLPAGAPP